MSMEGVSSTKPWKAEYAKSGRAMCRGCKNPIKPNDWRIAKVVPSTLFDGFMTMWYHSKCLFSKPGLIKSLDDVEGFDAIRWEDRQKLVKYVESGSGPEVVSKKKGKAAETLVKNEGGSGNPGDYAIENAKSSRSSCKSCNEKIVKGEVRVSVLANSSSANYMGKVPAWRHVKCFLALGWWVLPLEDIPGWDLLDPLDQQAVQSLTDLPLKAPKPGTSKRKVADLEDGSALDSKRKPRTKNDLSSEVGNKGTVKRQKKKEDGTPGNMETRTSRRKTGENESRDLESNKNHMPVERDDSISLPQLDKGASVFEKKLEQQTKDYWSLKDKLSIALELNDLRLMLTSNNMDPAGTKNVLLDRCTDGMMFGALGCCPMCHKGQLEYHDGQYKCLGFLTAWSKCTYSTLTPERLAGKWKIPETKIKFLLEWDKKQKVKKENRLLLPRKEPGPIEHDNTKGKVVGKKLNGPLAGLAVFVVGRLSQSQARWKAMIEKAGGLVHPQLTSETNCVVTKESELEKQSEKLQQAQSLKIPIVKEEYLVDCCEQKSRLPLHGYILEVGSKVPAMVKIKVKGRSAVHEDSGLQATGHILDKDNIIYNITLTISDLSTGVNSCYILQIIENDEGKTTHLFRKWGRVGNSKVGGQKLDKLGQKKAIEEFERLFREKTGNSWHSWREKDGFEKKPGKFYPVDIDFGVGADSPVKDAVPAGSKSMLDPRLIKLLKLLFDIETYRAAMMEFEIDMSEMPLGKLSKKLIEQGFQVLTEIQNLIQMDTADRGLRKGLLVEASNRFFTLIPSIQPSVIEEEHILKSKIQMLEALKDMEVASQLIESTSANGTYEDPLDAHYKKLHCAIAPLPRDSDDYQLCKKYLERTHAPTHTDWALELEDVYAIDRDGESEAYAAKEGLDNRMLLWHGSRTTNFVGILSQGLRIAPPEAPSTGYMFGKGLYFADLVSKSAQYCFTSNQNPTGLMLLCEVALGVTKEFKKAEYMEKPRPGSNSSKGVGSTAPLESEFEVWRNDVKVPCGRPVSSTGATGSRLLYNEYIVYDTAQVQMRFLLKVNFKHKR